MSKKFSEFHPRHSQYRDPIRGITARPRRLDNEQGSYDFGWWSTLKLFVSVLPSIIVYDIFRIQLVFYGFVLCWAIASVHSLKEFLCKCRFVQSQETPVLQRSEQPTGIGRVHIMNIV